MGNLKKEALSEWWGRRHSVTRFSLFILYSIILACVEDYIPPLIPSLSTWFMEEFQISDFALLVCLAIITYLLYVKLNGISATLAEIGTKLGIGSEEIGSPGIVYTDCKWLVLSRETETNLQTHMCNIYVRCSHPQKPITSEGCPQYCPYRESPPEPTGAGAFGGMVISGFVGLVLAGPAGAVIGGLIGAGLGHSLETENLQPQVKRELRTREHQGLAWRIHVEDC